MRHKAIALFNKLSEILERNQFPAVFTDYLVEFDSSVSYSIYPEFDNGKIGYIRVRIVNNHNSKSDMVFTVNSHGGMVVDHDFQSQETTYPQEAYVESLLQRLGLSHLFVSPISVQEAKSIPPQSNPYLHDAWRQGVSISKYWEMMFASNGEGEIDHVRLIYTKTGRVFDLDLYEAEKDISNTTSL